MITMLINKITQIKLPVCTKDAENAVENNPFNKVFCL